VPDFILMDVDTHGGNVHALARELGVSLNRCVDFSASINPLGPSKRVLRTVRAALQFTCHYPDPDCHSVVKALAKHWKLDTAHFLIGNGSCELIYLLPVVLAIRKATIIGPTFSEYARAVSLVGEPPMAINARREQMYRPPLQEAFKMIRTMTDGEAVFLCNPNSPTGQVSLLSEVLELLETASARGVWLIVDEAFMEYCEEHSVLALVPQHPRLIILRSFTKFYAVPGLRVGYLVAAPELVQRLRKHQPPWSVNFLAQKAAEAALRDRAHAHRSLACVQRERALLAEGLTRIPGMVVFPSVANFLLAELPPERHASTVTRRLGEVGMLVRDCSTILGLNDRSVRVAVRTAEENRQLVKAVGAALQT
jgi:threonine-phosphate decarboxylase